MQQLLLEAGLARKKIIRQHSCIVYADHDAWDSFIAKYYLNMETKYLPLTKGDSYTLNSVHGVAVNILQEHLVTFGRNVYKLIVSMY